MLRAFGPSGLPQSRWKLALAGGDGVGFVGRGEGLDELVEGGLLFELVPGGEQRGYKQDSDSGQGEKANLHGDSLWVWRIATAGPGEG